MSEYLKLSNRLNELRSRNDFGDEYIKLYNKMKQIDKAIQSYRTPIGNYKK